MRATLAQQQISLQKTTAFAVVTRDSHDILTISVVIQLSLGHLKSSCHGLLLKIGSSTCRADVAEDLYFVIAHIFVICNFP
jgi:hypothetical protein